MKQEIDKQERVLTIEEQQSYFVAKSNDIIQQSRFSMSVQEQKLMLYLISKIKPTDSGNELYTLSIREFNKVCNVDYCSGENYRHAKTALKTIADKSVWIECHDGSELLLRWLNKVHLNKVTNCFEISFHEDMLPFLYNLQRKYTRYSLSNVLLFQSRYAIRLYELLKSYEYRKSEITFTVEELRARLDTQCYKRFPDFRRYVIESAISDINAYSDIKVGYIPIFSKNAVSKITFTIEELTATEDRMRRTITRQQLTPTGKSEAKRREQNLKKRSDKLKEKEGME